MEKKQKILFIGGINKQEVKMKVKMQIFITVCMDCKKTISCLTEGGKRFCERCRKIECPKDDQNKITSHGICNSCNAKREKEEV